MDLNSALFAFVLDEEPALVVKANIEVDQIFLLGGFILEKVSQVVDGARLRSATLAFEVVSEVGIAEELVAILG